MENTTLEIAYKPYELLDFYLKSRGITGKWVADSLDVDVSYISKIRNGSCPLTDKIRARLNYLLQTDF